MPSCIVDVNMPIFYHAYRFFKGSHTIEDVMSIALASACGKFTAVICHTLILVLLTCHLQLFDRYGSLDLRHKTCPLSLLFIAIIPYVC